MLSLRNDQLDVSVLDPVQDEARLGSRYCSGGYVYQVTDHRLGALASGPGYPSEEPPPVFDGQGLPEAFRDPIWPGADPASPTSLPVPGTPMLQIGVGIVESPVSGRDMPVRERCVWQITQSPSKLVMATRQQFAGWALELTRELTLVNRTLKSETRLANVGRDPIHFRWYPHPFFPNPQGEACKFNVPVTCPENPGYELLDNGFIWTKLDHPWERRGHFQELGFEPSAPLVTLQRHPKLGLLAATCSYVPSYLPIWGNCNCFSFEPYTEQDVAPGAAAQWSVAYDF